MGGQAGGLKLISVTRGRRPERWWWCVTTASDSRQISCRAVRSVRADHRGAARAQGGGLGIGLSLTKRLVLMHGGTVGAESEGLGRGSTFTVRLPLAAEATAQSPASSRADLPQRLERRRLLVVDDHRDAAQSLALVARVIGCAQVEVAHGGSTVLDEFERFSPQLVLLDLEGGKVVAYRARVSLSFKYDS
jgi:hypothetical protein